MTTSSYAPPRANLERDDAAGRLLQRHARSIRAVGALHLLGAGLVGIALFVVAFGDFKESVAGMLLVMLGLCALQAWVGLGLWRVDRRVRTVAGLMHGFGLLGFPIGTLINGYILYLLFGEKGKRVFAPEYRQANT